MYAYFIFMSLKAPTDPANSADYETVFVCFEHEEITSLFASLLESRGVSITIVKSLSNCSPDDKIITEPQFFESLGSEKHEKCLLVGDRRAVSKYPALHLVQPLTAGKIERALSVLLS